MDIERILFYLNNFYKNKSKSKKKENFSIEILKDYDKDKILRIDFQTLNQFFNDKVTIEAPEEFIIHANPEELKIEEEEEKVKVFCKMKVLCDFPPDSPMKSKQGYLKELTEVELNFKPD